MSNANEQKDMLQHLKDNPPKLIGGYKRQGWATKVLEKISNEPIEVEEDGIISAMAVLEAPDLTYYPAFLSIDQNQHGKVVGVYLLFEEKEQFNLIPLEMAQDFIPEASKILFPFRYRTLAKIEGDTQQVNWPDFT